MRRRRRRGRGDREGEEQEEEEEEEERQRTPGDRSQHSVGRLRGSGQVQCTSWGNSAPFTSPTHRAFHSERAGKRTTRGLRVGARWVVRGHDTTRKCVQKGYKTSARRLPLKSFARRCSESRFFCAPRPAVQGSQGRSSRAPSPARPSLDLDHALPFVLVLR